VKVEELRRALEASTSKKVRVTIQEIRQPELDSFLVARSVAEQLEKRVAFRRTMKQAVTRTMRFGAKGIRIQVSGRLGGAEMSRTEWEREGRVPLHTLRADIDFGMAEAHTTFGIIGVKAWIYKGDIVPQRERDQELLATRPLTPRPPLDGGTPPAVAPAPAAAAAVAAPADAPEATPVADSAPAPVADAAPSPAAIVTEPAETPLALTQDDLPAGPEGAADDVEPDERPTENGEV
jgi:small subunit ribosomal protein S3